MEDLKLIGGFLIVVILGIGAIVVLVEAWVRFKH